MEGQFLQMGRSCAQDFGRLWLPTDEAAWGDESRFGEPIVGQRFRQHNRGIEVNQ
jgi:hypothetical protein